MHVMQLEKWVSNFGMENNGEHVKGILILNPFRGKNPKLRKENPFPSDMLDYSEKRGHCLILTEDLLRLYIDYIENLISKQEIEEVLFNTIGILKYKCL